MDKTKQLEELHTVIADNIHKRMEASGDNPRSLSVRAGLDETYLKKFFARPTAIPKQHALEAIARELNTTPEWLQGRAASAREAFKVSTGNGHDGHIVETTPDDGSGAHTPINPAVIAALVNPLPPVTGEVPPAVLRGDVRGANIDFPAIAFLPTDVPVYGTAAGSLLGGAFQFEGGVIDYVRRPPALTGNKNVYALFIEGTSMVPEHNPGDLRFAHTTKPPRSGDSVIVQVRNHEHDRVEAFIGHYMKKSSTELFLGKLNPEATVQVKLEYVIAVHKVLTMNEIFGV